MKRCPECGRTFTNNTLVNCLNDGAVLVEDVPAPPPYFGAPAADTPPSFADTPPAPPSEAPSMTTYTDTPLSAIPELQSPEMQAALKEALDKAGLSGLLDAGSAHSTISITTSTTTGQSGTPPGYAQTPLPYSAATVPHRRRSPWGRLLFWLLLLLAVFFGFRYFRHKADMPTDVAAAVKNADTAEVSAVRTLNPAPLSLSYTGPALARELDEVASLKRAHQTQESRLTAQEFSAYKPSADGSEAQVNVTETWDTETYSEPGHTLVGEKSGDVTPQTVYLARTSGGWRVENIVFHHS